MTVFDCIWPFFSRCVPFLIFFFFFLTIFDHMDRFFLFFFFFFFRFYLVDNFFLSIFYHFFLTAFDCYRPFFTVLTVFDRFWQILTVLTVFDCCLPFLKTFFYCFFFILWWIPLEPLLFKLTPMPWFVLLGLCFGTFWVFPFLSSFLGSFFK